MGFQTPIVGGSGGGPPPPAIFGLEGAFQSARDAADNIILVNNPGLGYPVIQEVDPFASATGILALLDNTGADLLRAQGLTGDGADGEGIYVSGLFAVTPNTSVIGTLANPFAVVCSNLLEVPDGAGGLGARIDTIAGTGLFSGRIARISTFNPTDSAVEPIVGFGRLIGGIGNPIFWFGGQSLTDSLFLLNDTSDSGLGVRLLPGDPALAGGPRTFECGQFITDDFMGSWQDGHFVYFVDAEDPPDYGSRFFANYRGMFSFGNTEDALNGGVDSGITKLVGWTGASGSGTPTAGNVTITTKIAGAHTDTLRILYSGVANDTAMLLVCNIAGTPTLKRVVRDAITGLLSAP